MEARLLEALIARDDFKVLRAAKVGPSTGSAGILGEHHVNYLFNPTRKWEVLFGSLMMKTSNYVRVGYAKLLCVGPRGGVRLINALRANSQGTRLKTLETGIQKFTHGYDVQLDRLEQARQFNRHLAIRRPNIDNYRIFLQHVKYRPIL